MLRSASYSTIGKAWFNAKRAWQRGGHDDGYATKKLLAMAESLLDAGPYSVMDKAIMPPSQDKHDYMSPAPYRWRDPVQDDAELKRYDGKRLPETELYSRESNKFDRTRLQLTFDHTTILALAWFISGEDRFADRAALLVRKWFLDPDTAMNPHLKYAQIILDEQREQSGNGIIETKDFYFFLDAVRLIFQSGKLSFSEQKRFRKWCGKFLVWLINSPQGKRAFLSQNNQGTYYDLQVASLAAFLAETRIMMKILYVSHMRAAQQFKKDGSQPEELIRTNSLHYCVFNLQGWFNLARIGRLAGMDLWNIRINKRGSPAKSLSWVLSYSQGKWPYPQDSEFNYDRLDLLGHLTESKPAAANINRIRAPGAGNAIKPVFHPYAGVQPFWLYSTVE